MFSRDNNNTHDLLQSQMRCVTFSTLFTVLTASFSLIQKREFGVDCKGHELSFELRRRCLDGKQGLGHHVVNYELGPLLGCKIPLDWGSDTCACADMTSQKGKDE